MNFFIIFCILLYTLSITTCHVDILDVFERSLNGMYFNKICPEPLYWCLVFNVIVFSLLKKKNTTCHVLFLLFL